ncbi:dihydrolipoamide dehydrogenase of pyruvate dehydrogenase complex [hydrocarbon metagenome]|uniref:dihydrolipoyl dehydrogenase n=1 Tax=hydrocarbon metagenome TaxID=938273 RepID=A0A0W8G1C8_9ZZZZ
MSKKIIIIGAGTGGYGAAFMAADLGMEVTLIDKNDQAGGVCLQRGCIPSKALLHIAKLLNEAKEAEHWGIKFGKPEIDIDRIRAWKNEVISHMTGGLKQLIKQRKINFIQGTAQFVNSNKIKVDKADGGNEELSFDYAVIATGSIPAKIQSFDIGSKRILDSTSALEIEDIPKKLLVVGGGYIGLELGTVYASLGSKVTVVEMTSGLLPGADRDLVAVLSKRVNSAMENVYLNTKVSEIKEVKNGLKVTFEGDKVEEKEQTFDKVLVSVGRKPVTEGFGLEKTKVQLDEKGFIKTDLQKRTDDPNIFAVGDVAGNPMLAHKATAEGKVVAEVIAGHKAAFEPNAIPAVVFTDPELAWVGLNETEAKEKGIKIEIAKFPWAASGRAKTLERLDGMTKLIIEPETERILGMGIVGAGAGELIAEGALAVEMAALARDVALTIHAHPTLSETVMESAESYYGEATHIYRPKRK